MPLFLLCWWPPRCEKRSAIPLFGSMYRRDKSPTTKGSEGIPYSSRQQNNQRRRNRAYPYVTHALGDHETQLPDSSPTPNAFQHQTSANHSRVAKQLKLQERRAVIPSRRSLAVCRPLGFLGRLRAPSRIGGHTRGTYGVGTYPGLHHWDGGQ